MRPCLRYLGPTLSVLIFSSVRCERPRKCAACLVLRNGLPLFAVSARLFSSSSSLLLIPTSMFLTRQLLVVHEANSALMIAAGRGRRPRCGKSANARGRFLPQQHAIRLMERGIKLAHSRELALPKGSSASLRQWVRPYPSAAPT